MKKQQQFTLFAALAALGLTGALVCAEAQAYGVKVVYPASTTSRIPVPTGSKREGTPPVKEDGELDVDTPIGQIELVLDSLSAIQATQLESAQALRALLERQDLPAVDRTNEVLDAIEASAKETQAAVAALQGSGADLVAPVDVVPVRAERLSSVATILLAVAAWAVLTALGKGVVKFWRQASDLTAAIRASARSEDAPKA